MADGIVKRMTNVLLIDPAEAWTAVILFVVPGGITYLVWRFETRWVAIIGLGALALVGVASLISIVGFLFARTTVDDATAWGAVVVEMRDFEFAPADVTVAQGDQLLLRGEGMIGTLAIVS